jgi:hypothetical protein
MGPEQEAGPARTWRGGAGERNGTGLPPPAAFPTSIERDPPTLPLPPVAPQAGGPAHRRRDRSRARPRPYRGLRRAVWAAATALAVAVAALVATELHTWHVFDAGSAVPTVPARSGSGQVTTGPAALKPISIGPSSAAYAVGTASFSVTVSTDRLTWVEARAGSSGATLFAGEVPAGGQKLLVAHGTLWLQVGAGGSTLVVRSGHRLLGTLHPLVAPWQVTFTSSAG